jgi:hypothetical protein
LAFTVGAKAKKRRWMKEIFKKRHIFCHENLLEVLEISEPEDYLNSLCMGVLACDDLLQMVAPFTEKRGHCYEKCHPR